MRLIGLAVILTLSLNLVPLEADAQQAAKLSRIGFLGNSTAALEANLVGPFREGLRDLGYVEGRNIVIEYRWAEGKYERFSALIGELVTLNGSGLYSGQLLVANSLPFSTTLGSVKVTVSWSVNGTPTSADMPLYYVSPTAIAAVLVILHRPHPVRLLAAYLAGSFLASLTVGALILAGLTASGIFSAARFIGCSPEWNFV